MKYLESQFKGKLIKILIRVVLSMKKNQNQMMIEINKEQDNRTLLIILYKQVQMKV